MIDSRVHGWELNSTAPQLISSVESGSAFKVGGKHVNLKLAYLYICLEANHCVFMLDSM